MNIVGFTDIEGMMRLAADHANYSIKPVTISEVLDLIQSQKSPITYCFYITGNQTVELFMKKQFSSKPGYVAAPLQFGESVIVCHAVKGDSIIVPVLLLTRNVSAGNTNISISNNHNLGEVVAQKNSYYW